MKFPLQRKMRTDSPRVTLEQSRISLRNLKGCLTYFMQLQWFPELPATTREDPRVPTSFPLLQLEMNPKLPLISLIAI